MSYILDALKKSEAQRQTQQGNSNSFISASGNNAAHNRTGIIILVAVALIVVVLLLWNVLSLTSGDHGNSAASAVVEDQSEPHIPVILPSSSSHSEAKKPASSAPATQLNVQQQPVMVSAGKSADPLESEEVKRAMPPLSALRRIPQLMINSHIYSQIESKRSVVMNNREWHEGDVITDGVYLKEITPDGIMLDVEGWPVHVGRSKGWQAIPGSD